jgi:hypothetical protein
MTEYEQILKVKEDAEARLRTIPGVHSVGIGRKLVRSRPTAELCIAVFLVRKRPLHELAPGEAVPPEIDGVKTDVVEMAVPRLVAADPGNLNLTIEDAGRTVTLRGHEPPGNGLGVVVLFTPDAHQGAPGYVFVETFNDITRGQIALRIAEELTFHGFPSTAQPLDPGSISAKVALDVGTACTLSLPPHPVVAVDDHDYTKQFLRGGTQIKVKSPRNGDPQAGTLGCIATVAATANSPVMVVGITCHHVLAAPDHRPSGLRFAFKDAHLTFAVKDTSPLPPQTIVIVRLATTQQAAVYGTRAGDTPTEVAAGIAAAISGLGVADVSATSAPAAPINSLPAAVVTVTGDTVQACVTYGPSLDQDSKLQAKVVDGLAIELSGQVAGDDYGIFVHVNAGGLRPTFGVFTQPPKGQALADVASDVVKAINLLPEDLRHAEQPKATPARVITASSFGARITMSDGQEVECIVKRDIRVGHPNEHFCSRCSPCCDDRIGRVLASRVDVDTALVQLDEGQKYKLAIQGFNGPVTGIYDPVQDDIDNSLEVSKRGRTTGMTKGNLGHLNVSGEAGGRLHVNSVIINPAAGLDYFCLPGDSGAAVVREDPGTEAGDGGAAPVTPQLRVVGIVFGQAGRSGLMTPIGQILAAFQPLTLTLGLAPGAATGVNTVPKAVMPAAVAARAGIAESAGSFRMTAAAHRSFFEERLEQAEREVAATAGGRETAAAVQRHLDETRRLVDSRRRVAAAWRRHGGPRILEAALAMLARRDQRLPAAVDGKPLAECLAGIERALIRYASPALAADLARFTPRLASFAGLTYEQVLAALRTGGAE